MKRVLTLELTEEEFEAIRIELGIIVGIRKDEYKRNTGSALACALENDAPKGWRDRFIPLQQGFEKLKIAWKISK